MKNLKNMFAWITLAVILTVGTVGANAGIIVTDKNECADSPGIIVTDFVGIIISGAPEFAGIMIADAPCRNGIMIAD